MKKSDFNKIRAMINNAPEVNLYHYQDFCLILLPGRVAMRYPWTVYADYIADGVQLPKRIDPDQGITLRHTGRGKKKNTSSKTWNINKTHCLRLRIFGLAA